jgi:hypothetical protein
MTENTELFNRHASALAEQFVLDTADIRKAYENKPESLTSLYNTMSAATTNRGQNIFWGVVALLTIPPVAIWPGYLLYQKYSKLSDVKRAITTEVAFSKSQRTAQPA